MRRALTIVASVALILVPPKLAYAAASCGSSIVEDSTECLGSKKVTLPGRLVSSGTDPSPDVPATDVRHAPYRQVLEYGGPNLSMCTEIRYRVVPAGQEPAAVTAEWERGIESTLDALPSCPVDPSEGDAETPAEYAVRYWQHIPLPAPAPRIQPGWAITGEYAYLETRGNTSHTYTDPDTPFGPLTIVASGRYFVDWGDGTRTGPYSQEGGPWPDGKIVHEYLWVGTYDVVVTEQWSATWTFGPEAGMLGELRTIGRIDDFPVTELQAVIYR